jgi:protein-disulfide isomerase
MKRTFQTFLKLLLLTSFLSACVDTTGLSPSSSRGPSPKSTPDARVVVWEYADLQCPACRAAHEKLTTPLLEAHGKDIRFEFRHFPLRTLHRYALEAAEAAECAADQGKFWEFVDLAYEKQPELSTAALKTWAGELTLDMDLFGRCTASQIKKDMIMGEFEAGKALGVGGTPTFFVNGTKVEAVMEQLTEAITAASATGIEKL